MESVESIAKHLPHFVLLKIKKFFSLEIYYIYIIDEAFLVEDSRAQPETGFIDRIYN